MKTVLCFAAVALAVAVPNVASAVTVQNGLLQCGSGIRAAKNEYKIRDLGCGGLYCVQHLTLGLVDQALTPCKAANLATGAENVDVVLSGYKVNRMGGRGLPVHGIRVDARVTAFDLKANTVDVDLSYGLPMDERAADETTWDVDLEVVLTDGIGARILSAAPPFTTGGGGSVTKGLVSMPAGTVPAGWTFGGFSFSGFSMNRLQTRGGLVQAIGVDARDPVVGGAGDVSGILALELSDGMGASIDGEGRVVAVIGDPSVSRPYEHSATTFTTTPRFGNVETKVPPAVYLCGLRRMSVTPLSGPAPVWALWGGWQTFECGYNPFPSPVYRTPYALFLSAGYAGPGPVPTPSTTPSTAFGLKARFDQTANGTYFP